MPSEVQDAFTGYAGIARSVSLTVGGHQKASQAFHFDP